MSRTTSIKPGSARRQQISSHKGSKAEATRVLILEAGTKLFFQLGVNEVSISRIMAEMGLTTGGFYKYFSSKEMLAAEVCDRTFRKARGAWEEQAARARQSSENPNRYLINQYLSFAEKGQCAVVAFSMTRRTRPMTNCFRNHIGKERKLFLTPYLVLPKSQALGGRGSKFWFTSLQCWGQVSYVGQPALSSGCRRSKRLCWTNWADISLFSCCR